MEVCRPPNLHMVGKRVGPTAAAAAAAPKGAHSCLLYLVDVASSKRYLVDSGSAFSILPYKLSAEPTEPSLMTADSKPLRCWGRHTCSVRTRTRESPWTFLLAPVAFPILGANFLSNFRLLVDISNKRLVARGGKLIQLVQGKRTCRQWWSRLLLHFPQWRHPAAASRCRQWPANMQGQPGSPRWWQRPCHQLCPPLLLHIPQWRHPAAAHQGCQQPASMYGGQEPSPEVQGRRRSQQAAPPSQAHGRASDRDHRHLACGLPLLPTRAGNSLIRSSLICSFAHHSFTHHSFAHRSFTHSLISLKSNERL